MLNSLSHNPEDDEEMENASYTYQCKKPNPPIRLLKRSVQDRSRSRSRDRDVSSKKRNRVAQSSSSESSSSSSSSSSSAEEQVSSKKCKKRCDVRSKAKTGAKEELKESSYKPPVRLAAVTGTFLDSLFDSIVKQQRIDGSWVDKSLLVTFVTNCCLPMRSQA